jgi:hypothetical protein
LSAYDNFDDRYLGPKSSDPTLDNDGNALLTGALYFNTSSNVMKVYTGSSWVAAYVSAAGVLLTANNLSDVASTATSRTNLNVPTRTGGDASGSWGIDITGNAATATTATNVSGGTASVTSITDSGNLAFTSTGNRITGDFSNATPANRVALQTSTTNGATTFEVIPNGTGTTAQISLESDSAVTTGSTLTLANISTEVTIRSNLRGAGTYTPMTFYTGGSERVRVDTSGNVGIGTSSPSAAKLVVRSGTGTAHTVLGNDYGSLYLETASGGPNRITSLNSALNAGQALAFNGAGGAEWGRFDTSGNLLVGTTVFDIVGANATGFAVAGSGEAQISRSGGVALKLHRKTNTGGLVEFFYNGPTIIGTISTNGSSTSYNTSSDYRLKENIAPMTGALAKVAALKPVTYTWKSTGEADEGFIAHELQEVCPSAVTGEKDAVDAEGNPQYQGIDTSFLVATLTAAIQELKAINDAQAQTINAQQAALTALTARVNALESN